MNKEISCITNLDGNVVRERISQFLERSGYRPIDPGKLSYKRGGSKLGTMLAISPKSWKTEVHAQITQVKAQETKVDARFSIDTTGQLVTEKESAFWDNELEEFKSAVLGKNPDDSDNELLAKSISAQNRSAVLLIAGLPAIFSAIFALFALIFSHSLVGPYASLGKPGL